MLMTHPIDDGARQVRGRDARRAQPRLHDAGALDAQLLAQARRARPPDGRRRARGEEPAQRDDDSPRAAEGQAVAARCRERRHAAGADRDSRLAPSATATGRRAKHVDIIGSEIQRLDQVLNGFLKFARPDELKLQPTCICQRRVSDIVTSVTPEAERMRVTVKHECPPDCPPINADPGMLRQALLNLALNACQAMPDGGTLRITCRAASRGRVGDRRRRHRRRHPAGEPAEDLRSLFHDQGEGQRDRPVDGLPNCPAPRRRGRGAIHARDAAQGLDWYSRRRDG